MIKHYKLKGALALSLGAMLVGAPLAVAACGAHTSASLTSKTARGVYSSFYNTTDMLAALGYQPDVVAISSDKTAYSDYLKPVLGSVNSAPEMSVLDTGQYQMVVGPRLMDGVQFNSEQILNLKVRTYLLNEWFKADAPKLSASAFQQSIAYTSMADGRGRAPGSALWGNFNWVMDLADAFTMLVDDLALIYPRQANAFKTRAAAVQQNTAARYAAFNASAAMQNAATTLRGKSLLILEPDPKSTEQEMLFSAVRGDSIYRPFYESDPTRGLGMNMPRPASAPSTGSFSLSVAGFSEVGAGGSDDFALRAKDSASLLSNFAGAADYVLVLKNPQLSYFSSFDAQAKAAAKVAQRTNDAARVFVVNRDYWYDVMWGPLGVNFLLDEVNQLFAFNAPLPPLDLPARLSLLREDA